jgi:hypothetical protein
MPAAPYSFSIIQTAYAIATHLGAIGRRAFGEAEYVKPIFEIKSLKLSL